MLTTGVLEQAGVSGVIYSARDLFARSLLKSRLPLFNIFRAHPETLWSESMAYIPERQQYQNSAGKSDTIQQAQESRLDRSQDGCKSD